MGKSWSHRGVIVALTALSWILGTVITFGSSATAASAPAAPVVTAISPVEGPKQGGTVLRVTGTGFTGATKVLFGTVAGTSLTVHSATTLDITSPPHKPAGVYVRVVTPAGASATGPASRFTYRRPPVVSSVAPDGGPNTGGTVVTITGARFAGASKVRFDNTAATSFTVVSPTEIRAVSPPMPDTGAVAVVVETPGGSGYLSAAFGYIPAGPVRPGPRWCPRWTTAAA